MNVTTLSPNAVQKLQVTGNITIDVGLVIFSDGDVVSWGKDVAEFSPKNCDGYGFVYGTTEQSDPGNVAPADSDYDSYTSNSAQVGNGSYGSEITALLEDTTYYIRAWAHDQDGYVYGDEVSIHTIGTVKDQFSFKSVDTSFLFKSIDTDFVAKFRRK